MEQIIVLRGRGGMADSNSAGDSNNRGKHAQRTYVDQGYINKSRDLEIAYHLDSVKKLKRKMARLANELTWELEQHRSKMYDLFQLETMIQSHANSEAVVASIDEMNVVAEEHLQLFDMALDQDVFTGMVA